MTKWEYKVVTHAETPIDCSLNAHGDEGWELVCVYEGRGCHSFVETFWKRPRRNLPTNETGG